MADFITAADVLRQQADLRDRFRDLTFVSATAYSYEYLNHIAVEPAILSLSMSSALEHARAYRVEHQMTEKLMSRAMHMSDDHWIQDPPFPSGFVVFEEPIRIKELRGRMELIHAIAWAPVHVNYRSGDKAERGILVTTWNDIDREPDEVILERAELESERAASHAGRWSITSIRPIINYQVGTDWIDVPEETKQKVIDDGEHTPEECTFNMLRIYAALFDMLSETVPATKRENAELTRTERKQAKHNKVSPEVCLVTLRPEVDAEPKESHPGTGHPLTVRVPLGDPSDPDSVAFYRTIYRGTERERRVPVHSHWRGPQDAPVSQRKTVRNLAR
jgi:hypothetical protein